jgi:hypothetical protein
LQKPAEWREKAAEYLDKAQMADDINLRERFALLAAMYYGMAEKIEKHALAAVTLDARLMRR